MTSDKKSAALLAEIFVKKGLKYIIISPGSRNAPLILSFAGHPEIKALSIIDERSAAFFALGMAQQLKQTVAIACTSGTAALNYAPAIAEAYYQKVPLLIITADRPKEMIDQGDGQTIRQKNLYRNYIKAGYEIPEDIQNNEEFESAVKLINKAINLTCFPDYGPVHINLPFSEPIYNQVNSHEWKVKIIRPNIRLFNLSENKVSTYSRSWNKYKKKLLIAGMMDPNIAVIRLLKIISDDPSVVLLTETTSNLAQCCTCPCIDKV
ncbi:MAG: 2-succinyl-5-enolpyruvyl-6-hydroxy-3-cyclohexene-1-carboxylic-acid synthase, partial [Bacteroidetes bacterium]|nr:2-succinyl-5-enolpyruvyl-6-hydroxy-3-cyclohexene-1-carboxylic-acid synthase [Bacteroidota bacterium]